MERERLYKVGIVVSVALVAYMHYSSVTEIAALHSIYKEFFYIPVFLGALRFGARGAIFSYLLVLILYLPYIFLSWTGNFISEADRFLHVSLLGLLGLSAGVFVDRDRRSRQRLEKERYLSGIGRVATSIAHDLKNPIVTVTGFARRIHQGKGDAQAAAQTILESAENMERIVNDVLDFGKPARLDLKEEDLREVVRNAAGSCREKAEKSHVNLLLDPPPRPVRAAVDGFRLQRALVNIMSNAIEACGEGQDVSVSAMGGEGRATIRIEDRGPGMDEETRANIFTPFYTRKSGGTGLGMAIAKKVVDAHEGEISLSSGPGWGTRVTISIPCEGSGVTKPRAGAGAQSMAGDLAHRA
jgi:signal transduction histidine kinase